MSKYDYVKNLKEEEFRLLTGVKKNTFNLMLKYLKEAQSQKRQTGKHLIKISIEDKLLLTLEYLRENRALFHIAIDYNVVKSTVSKIIYWVENILSKCDEFKLPSKRKLLESDMKYEVFVVDSTETPIERPNIKSKKNTKKEERRKEKN
jgi:hypothetical protein